MEDGLEKIKFLSRPYPLNLFKDCLPQNLLSRLLNALSHIKQNARLHDCGNMIAQVLTYFTFLYVIIRMLINRGKKHNCFNDLNHLLNHCKDYFKLHILLRITKSNDTSYIMFQAYPKKLGISLDNCLEKEITHRMLKKQLYISNKYR